MDYKSGKKAFDLAAVRMGLDIQMLLYLFALKKEGNPADYVLLAGAEHGDDSWYQKPVIERVVNWFKATLGAPKAAATAEKDKNANL